MFIKKPMAQCVALAVSGLFVAGVYAQDNTQKAERVEITGSSIKRIDAETAVPVTVIKREDIERSGAQSVQDLVQKISANNGQGYALANALGDSARPGFAGASLRGLGSNNTLVLLNGRRMAVYAFDGGGVNLNSIPVEAIERVEVLRDGASAIYGSDAIGGVLNFITRKDFKGAIGSVNFGKPQASGGGDNSSISGTVGFGDLAKDRFNVFGAFDFREQKQLKTKDRDFSKTAFIRGADFPGNVFDRTSANSYPANVFVPGVGLRSPLAAFYTADTTDFGCIPPTSFSRTTVERQCRFDYASVIDAIPNQKRSGFLVRGTFQLNEDNQLFAEYNYSKNITDFRISPTPASEATTLNGDPLLLPTSSRWYPTAWVAANFPALVGQPLNLYWRSFEAGPRWNRATSEDTRLLVGANGLIAGWDYKIGLAQAQSKATETYQGGYLSERKIIPAIASGVINPFGPNDAAGLAAIQAAQVLGDTRIGKSTRTSFDASVSREVFALPGGNAAVAFGMDLRNEKYNDNPLPVLNTGDIIGGGGTQFPVVKSRNVNALFGEINLPIMKTLEGQLALRHDRYNDFGSTTNPKASLRWQPNQTILVRGSAGTGFRAPTLPDLFQPQSQTNTGGAYDDPFYDAVAGGCAAVFDGKYCNAQLTVRQGGNPNLKPEKSNQFTVGVLLEPTRDLSIGVDFFQIKQKDQIGVILADTKLQDFIDNFNPVTRTSTSRYASDIVTKFDSVAGRTVINYINSTQDNVGEQTTKGVDVSLRWRLPRSSAGDFRFNLDAAYLIASKSRLKGDANFTENVATYATFGPVQRLKTNTSFSWERGSWFAQVTYNWQSSYRDQNPGRDGNPRTVGAYETFDLIGQWKGVKNLTASLGVINLLDRNPPYTNQNAYFGVGYDPTYADPRGRTVYGSLKYKFF